MPRLKPDWIVRCGYGLPEDCEFIDLCNTCYKEQWAGAELDIEHPPYECGIYYCLECRRLLEIVDNDVTDP